MNTTPESQAAMPVKNIGFSVGLHSLGFSNAAGVEVMGLRLAWAKQFFRERMVLMNDGSIVARHYGHLLGDDYTLYVDEPTNWHLIDAYRNFLKKDEDGRAVQFLDTPVEFEKCLDKQESFILRGPNSMPSMVLRVFLDPVEEVLLLAEHAAESREKFTALQRALRA